MKPIILVATGLSLSLSVLLQVIPEGFERFFDDFPFIAVIIFLWIQSDKRLERMLDIERKFFSDILKRIDARQNQTSDRVELLTQQLAMNTAATNESLKKDDVVDQLLEHLSDDRERRREGEG